MQLGDTSEAPDHVSIELEAMSILCGREAEARETGAVERTAHALAAEDKFITHHLAVWIPRFRDRARELPRVDGFYLTLVEAVYAFIVHEVDFLRLLRTDLDGAAA